MCAPLRNRQRANQVHIHMAEVAARRYTDKMSNDIIANDKTASDKMSKDKTANDKMSNATKQLKTKCLMRQNV